MPTLPPVEKARRSGRASLSLRAFAYRASNRIQRPRWCWLLLALLCHTLACQQAQAPTAAGDRIAPLSRLPSLEDDGGVSVSGQAAVLVVGPQRDLGSGDATIAALMDQLGLDYQIVRDNELTGELASADALWVVSSSALSFRVAPFLNDTHNPVVTWEPWLFDDLSLTGPAARQDYGFTPGSSALQLTEVDHPITAGLDGVQQVYGDGPAIGWGLPGAGADIIARSTLSGAPCLFAYERGRPLADGRVAEARRVGFFGHTDGTHPFSDAGLSLLRDSLQWAAAAQGHPRGVAARHGLLLTADRPLRAGDQAVLDTMEGLGLDPTVIRPDRLTRRALANHDLLVISNTVLSHQVADLVSRVAMPVVVWEPWLFDDLGMTGSKVGADLGFDHGAGSILITSSTHPIAGGASGLHTVYEDTPSLAWGKPSAAAQVLALHPENGKPSLFAYDGGSPLVDQSPAPARRVALFANTDGHRQLTPVGLVLIERALRWALGSGEEGGIGEMGEENGRDAVQPEPEPEPVVVLEISPQAGATDVPVDAAIDVGFSEALLSGTPLHTTVTLLSATGTPVAAVIGLTPDRRHLKLQPLADLDPGQTYTLELHGTLRAESGATLQPFSITFTTAEAEPILTEDSFRFRSTQVDTTGAITGVTIGPDGHLYTLSIRDNRTRLRRHLLDPIDGIPQGTPELLLETSEQILGMAFEPGSDHGAPALWITHASCNSLSRRAPPNGASSTVSRLQVPPQGEHTMAIPEPYVVGLPNAVTNCAHQINGLRFGPDGRLYVSVAAATSLGGTRSWRSSESLFSGSVIVLDLQHPAFAADQRPFSALAALEGYDPHAPGAPLRLFSTGVRAGYDLLFHSNGSLYTAINQNSRSGDTTPACRDLSPVRNQPHEVLARLLEGHYYGHPNDVRGECILAGGNPTAEIDPYEVAAYPVGTAPEPHFDSSLFYDLRPSGGLSPNGLAEFTAQGPLRGRILVAYLTGARTIQTLAVDDAGTVVDEHPLLDESGATLTFTGPLDVAVHPTTGFIYVGDFGTITTGTRGGVHVLHPLL